jgi:two-component system, NarL family, nitrate/nitrite response regulator NarL
MPSPCERSESGMALRVLVVDDHESVRRGVCAILGSREDIELCGEASDGTEAVAKVRSLKPDLIVMDISMPVMDGISASREIRKVSPNTAIIVLSMHDSSQLMETARQLGLRGYVTKGQAASSLLQAVDSVVAGRPFFPL